eukprot:1152156-Pelagomonas_calceolata.AAC.2
MKQQKLWASYIGTHSTSEKAIRKQKSPTHCARQHVSSEPSRDMHWLRKKSLQALLTMALISQHTGALMLETEYFGPTLIFRWDGPRKATCAGSHATLTKPQSLQIFPQNV